MTIKVKTLGYPYAKVEAASFETIVDTGVNSPWSFVAHNIGEEGYFGGGVFNHDTSPGDIILTWRGEELTLRPGYGIIIYTTSPSPNCIRIDTGGMVRYPIEGTYRVLVRGYHFEDTDPSDPTGRWVQDNAANTREFIVAVTGVPPVEEKFSLSGVVTGMFGRPVDNALVTLNGVTRRTNAAGEYAFLGMDIGVYTITVEKSFYDVFKKQLTYTASPGDYTEDVKLSLCLPLKIAIPIAAVGAVGGGVYAYKKARPAVPAVLAAPPGYKSIPEAPPGYKVVPELPKAPPGYKYVKE